MDVTEATATATARTRGRPRSEAARQAILEATRALLEVTTVRDLTIETIAKQAGVSKSTIYRWWPNKAAIAIDAVEAIM
jgi:AcrR family transcriptional regulator